MDLGNSILKMLRNNRAKKIAFLLSVSLAGVSTMSIVSAILAYDAIFTRYERPDYSVYPGMYCYERFCGSLPRETMKVKSGETDLQAYYYPAENSKGLVVVAHGFHAGADDYLPLIEAMVNGGYSVFTYDVTGNYSSGGEGGVGMCQQLVDLDNVLSYLGNDYRFADAPKLLIGHSWGGYAVSSVLAIHSEVKACVCIAPMWSGPAMVVEKGKEYVDEMADSAKPIFDAYQSYLFGDYTKYDAVVGINSTDIPILIAQGLEDKVITHDGQSITAHLDELTNPNIKLYYGRGYQGSHTGIWHSVEAEEYVCKVEKDLKALQAQKGEKLTDAEKAEFYKGVDHRLYSQVNEDLVRLIFETFEKGINKV